MSGLPGLPRTLRRGAKTLSLYQGFAGSMAEATRALGKYAPTKVMAFQAAAREGVPQLLEWLEGNVPNPQGWEGVAIVNIGSVFEQLLGAKDNENI